MGKNITKFGRGPKFALLSILYTGLILALSRLYVPHLKFVIFSQNVNIILGIILIVIGSMIFISSIVAVSRFLKEERLYTKGVYSFMRHPMYGAWLVYIVPGIILISGAVPGITVPIFMYLLFRILIRKEEKSLEERFGDEYLEYKKRVGLLFPKKRIY